MLIVPVKSSVSVKKQSETFLVHYFRWRSSTCDSRLPIQIKWWENCELLVESRYTNLMGFIYKALETIAVLRPQNGYLQTVARFTKIYKVFIFFTAMYTNLLFGHPNYVRPKLLKQCPNCFRILRDNYWNICKFFKAHYQILLFS